MLVRKAMCESIQNDSCSAINEGNCQFKYNNCYLNRMIPCYSNKGILHFITLHESIMLAEGSYSCLLVLHTSQKTNIKPEKADLKIRHIPLSQELCLVTSSILKSQESN